jgi:hypothetical protein
MSQSGTGLCRLESVARSRSRFKLYLAILLMASSASKSYHSSGAEFGDGMDWRMVKGESNINSGELVNSWGSKSAVTDLLVVAGDATEATAGLSAAIDEVGFEADSEP